MRWWVMGFAVVGWTAARADTVIGFKNFADVSALTFAGDARGPVVVKKQPVLRIVPATTYQSGAAYLTTPIALGPRGAFATSFQFRVTGTTASYWSDGMTFVLSASPAGLGASGATGSYLGYQGTPNSLAVEFDTYYAYSTDALPNEVAVTTDGNTDTIKNPKGSAGTPYGVTQCEGNEAGPAGCLNDGKLWTAMITYDGRYMNVTVQDGYSAPVQVISNYAVDVRKALGNATTVYAGFTAGTGEGYADFDVYDWSLRY